MPVAVQRMSGLCVLQQPVSGALANGATIEIPIVVANFGADIHGKNKIPARLANSMEGYIEGLIAYIDDATVVDLTFKFFANSSFSTWATSKCLGEVNVAEGDFHDAGTDDNIAVSLDLAIPTFDEFGQGLINVAVTNDDGADTLADGDLKFDIHFRPLVPDLL